MRGLRCTAFMMIAMGLFGCQKPASPLTHDAYIWQRQWTPALRSALQAAPSNIRQWRILAAQSASQGHLQRFTADRDALLASAKPIVLVIRLDGSMASWDEADLVTQIVALKKNWPADQVAGVEIDHDCATSKLAQYTHFLQALKIQLPDVPLSITALPTWLSSPQLDAVLAAADETVLQVHAVQAPSAGLFDPDIARQWIETFARHAHKPFRVALPTYGSRVSWDENGQLIAVQSEATSLTTGASSAELAAKPAHIAALLAALQADPPKYLAGIVWFRLPTTNDRRAWSMATWQAVLTGTYVERQIVPMFQPSSVAGATDVVLRNDGDLDAAVPTRVALPDDCASADGINGFSLQRLGSHAELVTRDTRILPAHAQRKIGWLRCSRPSSIPNANIGADPSTSLSARP